MRIVSSAVALVFAVSSAAATVIPVEEFRSVELRNGGHVIVRYGAVQRVTLAKGDPQYTRIRVRDQQLVIDRTRECPPGYRIQVEIVTPHLSRVAVSNGGSIRTDGAFPDQESIKAAVEQGGMIDIRSIAADDVDASVYSGGRIFTTSRDTLTASVESGGAITYWGSVKNIQRSIRDGGVVTRGKADEADKPISGLGSDLPPIPPIPPMPPAPVIPSRAPSPAPTSYR